MRGPILAALLLLASQSFAAPKRSSGASVKHVSGAVSVTIGGEKRAAKTGDRLGNGDSIGTAKGATAILEMPEGSLLKLKESSTIKVNLPETGEESGATLSAGGVFARVTKRLAGAEFRIRAGPAVASVRGTEFFTAYGRPGGKGRDLWVCVNKGAVDVGTPSAKEPRLVPAGKGVLIKSGLDVGDPQPFEWTRQLNWNMDPAAAQVEDKVDLDKAYSDLLDQDYR